MKGPHPRRALRELTADVNTADRTIALKVVTSALRAVEKRDRRLDGAALVLHADGSGRVTAGDEERVIFEFDYPRHLAQWIGATDAERRALEEARAVEQARGEAEGLEYFEAQLGAGGVH